MELGIYTFGETTPDPDGGRTISPAERLRDLVEEAVLAEQVGLDVFGVGEHHRPDFAVATPAVVLAYVAARTQRIRLTSAATVLGSDDPVRVFQEFATLDLLSGGRAEIMAGRGSFIESFPLFGYDLADYDTLFSEKLDCCSSCARTRGSPGRGGTARRWWTSRCTAPGAGPDAGMGRGRRHAAVGVARRTARPADGARDHRRRIRALRPDVRAVPRAAPARRPRSGEGAGEPQPARVPCPGLAGCRGPVLPLLRRRHDADRPGTRLAADDATPTTPCGRRAARSRWGARNR